MDDNIEHLGKFNPETGEQCENGIPVVRCDKFSTLIKTYNKGLHVEYSGRTGNIIIEYADALVKCLEDTSIPRNRLHIINPYTCPLFKKSTVEKYTINSMKDTIIKSIETVSGTKQNKQTAKKLVKYKDVLFNNIPVREGVFIHVRLGDALRNKNWVLSFDYYIHALSKLPVQTGYVSSDTPDHPIVKKILSTFPEIKLYKENFMDTLQFGSSFQYKVLGLGTYSWLIGFLGTSDKVICPTMSHFFQGNSTGWWMKKKYADKLYIIETGFPRGTSHCDGEIYLPELGWYYV